VGGGRPPFTFTCCCLRAAAALLRLPACPSTCACPQTTFPRRPKALRGSAAANFRVPPCCTPLHLAPRRSARFCPVLSFDYTVPELGPCEMVMTSVAGHLLELGFVPPYNKWYGCEARQLYDAAVVKSVNKVGWLTQVHGVG
jgi:hypothetical protein